MSMTGIILAAVVVGGTGLFIGVFLGIAGKKFAVKVDEREEAILGVLPGNNCGGCGYAGCSGLAAAIVKGEAEVSGCPVGGAPAAAKIGDIMGVAAGTQERQTAFVKCAGTCEKAILDYDYTGIQDCTMASMMQNGGAKGCNSGCLGFGSCCCPNQCKFGKIQTNRPCSRSLSDHNVDRIIFHCRVKHFFHLTVKSVNLIHK